MIPLLLVLPKLRILHNKFGHFLGRPQSSHIFLSHWSTGIPHIANGHVIFYMKMSAYPDLLKN